VKKMAETGKILSAIGGIVVVVSTFLLSLDGALPFVYSGLNFAINIPTLLTSGDVIAIIGTIVFIVFLASGVFLLVGIASRAMAIIGSILPILVSILFILANIIALPAEILQFVFFFFGEQYFGFLPFHLLIWEVGLGTFTLLAGGVLGLIGGILPREEFYY
jgi:hypothetical protein